jgi:hypothetical protein
VARGQRRARDHCAPHPAVSDDCEPGGAGRDGTDLMSYNGQIISNYSAMVKPGDPNVKQVHGGGIEWTIKDGIPYHVPTLMQEVKDMVTKARAARGRATSNGQP